MNADFVELVNAEYEKEESCFYIGEGNPDADILIIGNECARREDGKDVATQNIKKWKERLAQGYNVRDICNELESYDGDPDNDKYYPLFPWFGQKCIVRTEVTKDKEKKVRGKKGTARTWVQYQKLVDLICGRREFNRNNFIDFHLDAFHTELSQIPMMRSGDNDQKDETANSIQNRLAGLFSKPFFKKFPVVIIAAGHYVRDYKINNIEEIFNVTFDEEKSPLTVPNKKGRLQWINLHYDNDSAPRRVLLHTEHFAATITDDYIRKIAEVSRPYILKTK